MASVGLDETAARKRYRAVLIGQAKFHEIACGPISDIRNGLLNKMVADPTGEGVLGVQIIGERATELIHVGQMALQPAATIDSFAENIFNFPRPTEIYRVAAVDIVGQRQKRLVSSAA
jgi:NAD(P) transhydrogenase